MTMIAISTGLREMSRAVMEASDDYIAWLTAGREEGACKINWWVRNKRGARFSASGPVGSSSVPETCGAGLPACRRAKRAFRRAGQEAYPTIEQNQRPQARVSERRPVVGFSPRFAHSHGNRSLTVAAQKG